MSRIYSPVIRAYRSCGFHNRTLAEIRANSSLARRAVLNDADLSLAHVPNVFGNYEHRGVKYHTALTLAGIDDPFEDGILKNPSRGLSVMKLTDIDEVTKIWEFQILIPKNYCREDIFKNPEEDANGYGKFCSELCDRTSIFAMEFLCCYRFFIEQILETYQLGNSEVREPVREKDKDFHPKREEAESLICTYDAVGRNLEWFREKYSEMHWNFDSVQQFLGLHVGRNRSAMWPYYQKWLVDHRVDLELVERKTIEYISMAFLTDAHQN